MLCYKYDANGLFTEAKEVKFTPNGDPLIPALSTTTTPPPEGPGPWAWNETAGEWFGPTLEQAKADKLVEARDKMEDFLKSQVSEYCDCEKQTWDQQATEADALAVDPEAPAPLVRAIAAYRGMTVETLVQRILANAAVWKAMAGGVTGQRLAFFDRVAAAETVEEVRSIAISYSIPAEVAGIQLYYQSLRG